LLKCLTNLIGTLFLNKVPTGHGNLCLILKFSGVEMHEVAAAIAWLLSDEASYVTGAFIDRAGGK
jgi:NAD(P)-dependent dehydrogenase (short-subunit alcohol dehydrogenase family)